MAYISFNRTSTLAQAKASTNPDKVFFPTDSTSIVINGQERGAGTVTQVKVGSTAYNPSNGVINLPAYPTTKADVGLGNVDNTADAEKSVNYANTAGHVPDTEKTTAQAIAELYATIEGLTKKIKESPKWNDAENGFTIMGQKVFDITDGDPDYIPLSKGLIRMNPSNGDIYMSVTTTGNTNDWKKQTAKPSYSYSEISNTPSSLPASDVSEWAKQNNKPSYTLDEVNDGSSRKIPTKTSQLANDSGYLTSHQSLSSYATQTWVNNKFDDMLGINADAVSTLKSVLSDDDKTTGLLVQIAGKVDKEAGKGLSTNDYTDAEKDKVTAAYNHSQATHARTDATKVEASTTNGYIKINGTETKVYAHPTTTATDAAAVKVGKDAAGHVVLGGTITPSDIGAQPAGNYALTNNLTSHTENTSNPHNVTKAQIGLGNVENKSVSQIGNELLPTPEQVIAATLAQLLADVEGIKKKLEEGPKWFNTENGFTIMEQKLFDLTSGAPSYIPLVKGLIRMDADTGHVWISKSVTNNTSDWKQIV